METQSSMKPGDEAFLAFNYGHTQGVEKVKLIRRTPMTWRFLIDGSRFDALVHDKTRDRKLFATREEAFEYVRGSLAREYKAARICYTRREKALKDWNERKHKVLHPLCSREIQENT